MLGLSETHLLTLSVCLLVFSCEDPGERGIIKFGQQFYLKTLPGIGGDVRYTKLAEDCLSYFTIKLSKRLCDRIKRIYNILFVYQPFL